MKQTEKCKRLINALNSNGIISRRVKYSNNIYVREVIKPYPNIPNTYFRALLPYGSNNVLVFNYLTLNEVKQHLNK